jgi:Cdc6-like AAA superfamily ATPase
VYLYVSPLCPPSDCNLTPADISGVPGTGKTATVHAVVRELKHMAEQNVWSLVCDKN